MLRGRYLENQQYHIVRPSEVIEGLLKQDFNSLDQALMATVEKDFNKPFIASHPVYQYLARRYNINLQSLMWEPEVVPDQIQWHELQQLLTTHNSKWMVWEGMPDKNTDTRLQEVGISSLVFNPCANAPKMEILCQ